MENNEKALVRGTALSSIVCDESGLGTADWEQQSSIVCDESGLGTAEHKEQAGSGHVQRTRPGIDRNIKQPGC